MNFSQKDRDDILTHGACAISKILTSEDVEEINKELSPWLNQIAWNDTPGYTLVDKDKWLLHLGICSPTLIKIALNHALLDFLKQIFDEEPILAEASLHRSESSSVELPYHSDRDGGILLFIFLSDMNEENGQFCYIPGTQDKTEHFFIPALEIDAHKDKEVAVSAKTGDAVFFDQDVWHRRKAAKPGRMVVKLLYHAQNRIDGAIDHLYRQSILANLTERQLRCYGIGKPAFMRLGQFTRVGLCFSRHDLRVALQYMVKFFRFSWCAPIDKNKSTESKLKKRPDRQRAKLTHQEKR